MNFKMEVMNIVETRAIIKNWLDVEGLQLMKTFTYQKDKCRATRDLFSVLSKNFKPQHNRIIISLQCYMLHRKSNESTKEWMGRLQRKEEEYEYEEYNRLLKEQMIGGVNDEGIKDESTSHRGHKK